MSAERTDKNMHVVWGDRKAAEFVTLAVEMTQGILDDVTDIRLCEQAGSMTSIEKLLQAGAK